MQINR